MLSIVVVGRNDAHGYNLSKRVATSLNSLSLPMTGSDELIFVDWNSDDINPTFIDAIRDTLTEKTLKHLVVYRVRTKLHQELSQGIKRPILEPIARNVGIRRAKNNWILSTNTDMIFNAHGKSYKEILEDLRPGLYHLFRYEIPEYVWDQFNRFDPHDTNRRIEKIIDANNLVLQILTTPYEGHSNFYPDAVGDFQLTTREIWDSVKGFPEDMLKGWHVDSRLSVNIENLNTIKAQIIPSNVLQGYHQNHLRVLTHFHANTSINSLDIIKEPYSNSESWGLANMLLENDSATFINIDNLSTILETNKRLVEPETLQSISLNSSYQSPILDFFILDDILNLPNNSRILISSVDVNLILRLENLVRELTSNLLHIEFTNYADNSNPNEYDMLLLDFGLPDNLNSNDYIRTKREFESTVIQNLQILNLAFKDARVVVIKSQHWLLRSLIHDYCVVPLFNNYSQILSGKRGIDVNNISKKIRNLKSNLLIRIYINSVNYSFGESAVVLAQEPLEIDSERSKLSIQSLNSTNLQKLYKRLPLVIRNTITPKLRKLLGI